MLLLVYNVHEKTSRKVKALPLNEDEILKVCAHYL